MLRKTNIVNLLKKLAILFVNLSTFQLVNLYPMARQAGPIYFTGTIDDITFYKMEDQYYARKKSSLDRKQFRTDPKFKRSRVAANKFGEASKLASTIYWHLPKALRGKGVVNRLTGQVGRLLKEGKEVNQIIEHFKQLYTPVVAKPVAQFQPKEVTAVPIPLSNWNVTATGKLKGKGPELILNTNLIQGSRDSRKQKSKLELLLE